VGEKFAAETVGVCCSLRKKRRHGLALVGPGKGRPERVFDVLEVQAEGHRDGRVEIGHGDGIFRNAFADRIGPAVDVAAFRAASGQPPGEDAGVVAAPSAAGSIL